MGFAAGGNDYANKDSAPNRNNFGGGGGTGVSINPIGFLVVDAEGGVDMININNPTNDLGSSIESIMEKLPGILDKVKSAFESAKKTDAPNADAAEPKSGEEKANVAAPKADAGNDGADAKAEEVLEEILSKTAKTTE
jgi:uncharacterized spore protein YtfJ